MERVLSDFECGLLLFSQSQYADPHSEPQFTPTYRGGNTTDMRNSPSIHRAVPILCPGGQSRMTDVSRQLSKVIFFCVALVVKASYYCGSDN